MSHADETNFLPEERIVEVAPRFEKRVADPVPRRLNYVAGRSLTADALKMEQSSWDRRTALAARALNPGILTGLEVELLSDAGRDAAIRITPGTGIAVGGLDLVLHRALVARIADIPASEPLTEVTTRPTGLVGLFLKPVRAITASNADPEDPCPVDPDAYAYADLITQDAVQLVWARLEKVVPSILPEGEAALRPVRPDGGAKDARAVLGPISSTNVTLPPNPLLGRADPITLPISIHRNLVANRVIEAEAQALRRGAPPPWARHGLPLAVADITEKGDVVFLDRFAIARQGGAVRKANPNAALGISHSLRRARFDQFVDHLQAIRGEGAAPDPATNFFRTLPPVGVLPAKLFDTRKMLCPFFPAGYVVEAAPIQLSQMEAALAARSGLEPFTLSRRDYVQLMVPVPDHLFDPRLLIVEEISDAFAKAIREAEIREAQKRAELAQLEAAEPSIMGAIDMTVLEPEKRAAPPDGSAAARLAARARALIVDVFDEAGDVPFSEAELKAISPEVFDDAVEALNAGEDPEGTFEGMKPLVEDLAARIDSANDHADMGFLRLQADIFRMRKQMVGETDATRLATSPVLANLATTTTGIEAAKIFESFAKEPPQPRSNLKISTALRSQLGFQPMATMMVQPADPISAARAAATKNIAATTIPMTVFTKNVTSTFGKTVAPVAPVTTPAESFVAKLDLSQFGLSAFKRDVSKSLLQASDIAWQGIVYGKASPVRTTTVAERLRPSPAQEAKNAAVVTKAEVIRGVQDLGLNLEGLQLPVSASRVTLIPKAARGTMIEQLQSGGDVGPQAAKILGNTDAMPLDGDVAVLSDKHLLTVCDLTFPRYSKTDNGTEVNEFNVQIYAAVRQAASELYKVRLGLDHDNLAGLILSDRLDPDPEDADEGAFYAAAVDALESAVSMLRLFEKRVQSYVAFLAVLREKIVDAIDLSEEWTDAKDAVQADIDEALHDQGVAKALMVEEQARLDGVNARRRDILDKHVDIVAFGRPMTADRLKEAPGLPLYRPLSEILPACLERDEDLPDEIEEILEALRDAPIAWYPEIAAALKKLRRPWHYHTAWQRGIDRASLWMTRNADLQPLRRSVSTKHRVAGKATTGVYLALSSALAARKAILATRVTRTVDSLKGASWSSLNTLARDELSIEDLETSGKAGRSVARQGARMLEQIGAVAGCFLDGLRKAPASLRLRWAETLSEHDAARDLSRLTSVPAWGAVPFGLRRELEHLHAWMFARIDAKNEDARAMMSLLVRICLLMSSHAPVSSLVEGVSVEEKEVDSGESFLVDVKTGFAAVGMIATFGTEKSRGRGVIEDIVDARARVRVTEVSGARISLAGQTPIAFSAPVAMTLADFSR